MSADLARLILGAVRDEIKRMRLVARCTLTRVVASASHVRSQVSTVAGDEGGGPREVMQHWGFRSTPPVGTQGVLIRLGAGHEIVIATEDKGLVLAPLASGSSGLYTTNGWAIACNADGSVEVIGQTQVKVTAPTVIVDSDDIQLTDGAVTGVARIGDTVTVGGVEGTITSASAKVKADTV